MNLRQMRERIANKTDHDPEETAYRDQMTLLLNEAYEQVWNEHVWPFTQKLVYFDLLPDLSSTRLQGQTVTTNDGQRLVTFSASVDILTHREDWVVGNPITLFGRDYEILQVNSATTLVLTEPVRHPAVGTPPTSPATTAGNADWTIKFRYYILPDDCLEVLNLGQRDTPIASGSGPLSSGCKVWSVANRPEESLGLRENQTADFAQLYFPIPPKVVPAAETLGITWIVNVAAANGTFPGGEFWEFCWCLMSPDGVYGPLSDPLISQAPTNDDGDDYNLTLQFLTFDGRAFAARAPSYSTRGNPEPLEGLRKVVWFNANFNHTTGQRLGEPKWLQDRCGRAERGGRARHCQSGAHTLHRRADRWQPAVRRVRRAAPTHPTLAAGGRLRPAVQRSQSAHRGQLAGPQRGLLSSGRATLPAQAGAATLRHRHPGYALSVPPDDCGQGTLGCLPEVG